MADGSPRTPIVMDAAADRLYIIDARNGVERRILLDWIHSTSGDEEPAWASLDIDIPAFATDNDLPTGTSAGTTARLGRALAEVITADL